MRPMFIVVLAVAVASAACVQDNPGLVIAGNIQADDSCVFAPSGGTLVAYGTYDVAFEHSYLVSPYFRSGLVARGDPTVPRAEPNDIIMEGAVVDLTDEGGASLGIASYTVAMTAYVPAAVDGTAGEATGLVQAIPAATGRQLAALTAGAPKTIVANMAFFGHTVGGTAVDASPWAWTIQVCTGCLQAPCATMLTGVCFPGQDGYQYLPSTCVAAP